MIGTSLYPLLPVAKDEFPTSALSRHAALHGRTSVRFCTEMRLSYRGIVAGEPDALDEFGRLIKVEGADLRAMALSQVDERRFAFRSEHMVKSALLRATKRVCPLCLADDVEGAKGRPFPMFHAYGRAVWQLAPLRSCQVHGVLLEVAGSARASSELHEFMGPVLLMLADLPALRSRARPVPASPLETYLHARLDGARSEDLLGRHAWYAAADLCAAVGVVRIYGLDIAIQELDEMRWRAAGDAGFAILKEGPEAVRRFLTDLDRRFQATNRAANDGPQARYGYLFQRLNSTRDDPAYNEFRDLVFGHVVETSAVGPGTSIFGLPVTKRIMHSVHSAAIEYKTHRKRLRKILVEKGILDRADTATDERAIFCAEATRDLLEKACTAINHREVRDHLNVPRVQARILLEEGFIAPFVVLPGKKVGSGEKNFARADLDAFLAQLLSTSVEVDQPPPGAFDIPAAAKRANCGAGEILRLILGRHLKWVGCWQGKRGFMSILVDLAEIKSHVHRAPLEQLTARNVQKILGTTHAVVDSLIKHGVLPTSLVTNPVNRCPTRIIEPADVEAFQATYVALHTLARDRGCHFNRLKVELTRRGIKPALAPDVFKATFYRRSDVV